MSKTVSRTSAGRYWLAIGLLVAGLPLGNARICQAQEAGSAPAQDQPGGGRERGPGQNGPRPLMGRIQSLGAGTMTVARIDGSTVTVKLTDATEFRKDREPAKVSDFKVGDGVMVRGEVNADNSVTATMIGGRTGGPGGERGPGAGMGGGANGPGGRGMGGGPPALGTLGKDYVAGEIKSIDAPKLTVLRTDNVTQTLELNEESSLRRGRENITMADIKVGDHLVARGAVANGAFVPKVVTILNAEQWERMQQRAAGNAAPGAGDKPAPPATEAKPQP